MAGKKKSLTPEEKLARVLVPQDQQPYKLPKGWVWTYLLDGFAKCCDSSRKPVSASERATLKGDIPYYGATGQVGWINDYLTNEELVLIGEDGAPFLDVLKDKAYIINGKAWINNHAHILKSYFGHIGNLYLVHYLNSFDYRGFVNGTTRLKLTQGNMKKVPIPLPPLPEQQRIVARIESLFTKLDAAREKLQHVLDTQEARRAAILHEAFTGRLTGHKGSEEGREKREEGSSQHPEGTAFVPEGWKATSAKDLFQYVTSGSRGWAKYYADDGALFIRMGNLKHGTIQPDFTDKQYVQLPDKTEGQRSLVQDHDILISITADVGMIGYIEHIGQEAYINQHIALARPAYPEQGKFIAWYLVSDIGFQQLKRKQRGATKVGLGLNDIRNLVLYMPPIEEQNMIIHKIEMLLDNEKAIHDIAQSTLSQIDLLKKSILARAFRGQLGTQDPSDPDARDLLTSD